MTTIKIFTKTEDGVREIEVDQQSVLTEKSKTIEFYNDLQGNPTALITFHTADGKKTPVPGLCQESSTQFLKIGPKQTAPCTITKGKPKAWEMYAYSVSSDPATHKPLDPVIIIQPTSQFVSIPIVFAIVIAVSVLTGWIGFRIGRAEFK